MTGTKTSFEIQVLADKRWVIADLAADEAQAKIFADNLLNSGNHAAVRVIRDFERLDGTHAETVLLEKKAPEKGPSDPSLSPITEAPVCDTPEACLGLEARIMIGRLLRKYLDEVLITPTELLHDGKELKRFGDKGTLLFSAIDRVAGLQSRAAGEEGPAARRAFLESAWEELLRRGRAFAADRPKAPASFAEARARAGDGPEAAYTLHALLSLALLERRNWMAKLDLVLAWAAEPGIDDAVLDGLVADLTLPAQMIQDLLGFQANLAAALGQLVELAEGNATTLPKGAPASFEALNALFAAGRLPASRSVLIGRVIREVGGANPLSRNDPGQEFEMFHKLLHRLVGRGGVVGGPPMSVALVQRGARVLGAGQAAVNAEAALKKLVESLSDGCRRLSFLLCFLTSPLGRAMGASALGVLSAHVERSARMEQWAPAREPPRERMMALKDAEAQIRASAEIPPPQRDRLASKVDDVMVRYLQAEEVIEKIDKPDDPLAMRAIRLVKFCGSGVLIPGRSLDLAKARVIEHLRQKQFEEKFLASVPDPAQAEKALRDFHHLLVKCGFS